MIKKLLYKNPIKFCISFFVIGIIVGFTISVIAESINSDEVLYDNSNSNTSNDNVQDALDEMYNIIEHNSTGFSLMTRNPNSLSTELVAGLYRYQGVQDANNNVDNYICFGTTNKNDCISNTDAYMYRIIGINEVGQLKLIKKEALNTTYQWSTSTGVDWAHSSLYTGLNGSSFLTNTTYVPDSSWSNRIVESDWHYWTGTNANMNAATMASTELEAGTVNAKIGLMYLHDYYYGLEGGNNCYSKGSTCKTSWLYLSNNDTSAPNTYEWTISHYNSNGYAWLVGSDGSVRFVFFMDYNGSVRPVFYLQASERIASGSGTIADPYVLS